MSWVKRQFGLSAATRTPPVHCVNSNVQAVTLLLSFASLSLSPQSTRSATLAYSCTLEASSRLATMAAKQSRTSSWTFCLVLCLLCLSCAAAKRPRKSEATHVAESKTTLAKEANIAAKIQAKLQPGPEYRAETEEDDDSYGKGKGKYAPKPDEKYYDKDSEYYGSDRPQDGYKAPSDYEQQYSRDNPKGPYAEYRDERDSYPGSREESKYSKEEPSTYGSYHGKGYQPEYQHRSYQEEQYKQPGYQAPDREQYQPRYDGPSKYNGPSYGSDKQPYGVPRPGDNYNAGGGM